MSDYEQGRESSVAPWRAVLALAFAFSYMGRQILPLLEPIRHAFSMSDTQIGTLQGLAFSSFYACAGIPLGWLVDRYHRVSIAASCVAGGGRGDGDVLAVRELRSVFRRPDRNGDW